MPEILSFYQAILPRMENIVIHLNRFALSNLPEWERRLLQLALSFKEVSFAVEIPGSPDEFGTFSAARLRTLES